MRQPEDTVKKPGKNNSIASWFWYNIYQLALKHLPEHLAESNRPPSIPKQVLQDPILRNIRIRQQLLKEDLEAINRRAGT